MGLRQLFQHRRAWHVLLGAPLIVCVLLVSGCSTRFIYERLDTFAAWYLESLVSLNDGQRSELRAWLERTLAWHRESELERYAAFVSDLSATVAQPGSPDSYDALRIRFQGLIDDLIAKTAPEASQLLLRLSPQQVDELLENLEKRTSKSTKESAELVADDKWRPRQTKGFIKQMKRWTGSVTPQQKALIAAAIGELEPTYEGWAASQRAWREALHETLVARAATEDDAAAPRLVALLEDPNRYWTPEFSEKNARNRDRYQKLLLDLDASLSNEQRAHLRAELDKLAATLARLARD
jgi:hypothetical protein